MSLVTPDFGLLFWMTIIFALVFFLLAKFGFPMITKMVNKRSDYIAQSLLDAQEARRQLEGLAEEQKRQMKIFQEEQQRLLNEAANERDQMIEQAREKARREAANIVTDARRQIAEERENTLREVRREVAVVSVAIAEKLLREKLSDKDCEARMMERLFDETTRALKN